MIKAKDIMSTDVLSVDRQTPIYQAVELLIRNEITGMPVVDADMSLVGVITEKDLLRLFYADEDTKNGTVKDFMTRKPVYYREDTNLKDICDFMLINYFRRIPVTSRDGKVVGIISRPDVLEYILQTRRAEAT